jgi:multidrug resistance efflux pump
MKKLHSEVWSDFPALDLVRSSSLVRRIGRITFTVLVFGALGLLFVPWRQTSSGTGIVLAKNPQERAQPFKSPSKGIVKKVRSDLREGSFVEEGEELIELEPAAEGGLQQLDIQLATVRAKADFARSKVQFAEEQIKLQAESGLRLQEALAKELEAATTKWEQAKSELAGAESDLVDKSNKRRIAEEVYAKGIISQEELVTKTQDEQTQKQKVAKAKQAVDEALANLDGKRKDVESKQNDIQIKNREAQNKKLAEEKEEQSNLKELSDLEVKKQEFQRLKIYAPRTGFIQQWFGVEGSDTIKEGDQLFVIVPETKDLAVEMMINGNDMPLIQVGDKVRLQFEGWPAVQFIHGWPAAAIGTFGAEVNRVFPTDDGKGNFRILLTPDKHLSQDRDWPDNVRQGVRTSGWVLLREVPLGYEIWRRINGFPPAKNAAEDKDDSSKKPKFKQPKL